MSRSISPPWIVNYVLGFLQDRALFSSSTSITSTKHAEPKVVQVLHVIPEFNSIIISDTVNSIAVFITLEGVREVLVDSNSSGTCLDRELRYCQIKIDNYHLSTLVRCASLYDIESIRKTNRFSCPLSFHCSRVVYLGNSICFCTHAHFNKLTQT